MYQGRSNNIENSFNIYSKANNNPQGIKVNPNKIPNKYKEEIINGGMINSFDKDIEANNIQMGKKRRSMELIY